MIRKTLLLVGLIFPFFSEGALREDKPLGSSASFPSLCDCTLDSSHEDCDRNCEWLCNTGAALKEGTDSLNKKCMKTAQRVRKSLFDDTVGLLSLKGTLKDIERKAAEKKPPAVPGCPNCTMVERLDVNVNPAKFKEGSCPEQYLKTHSFQRKVSLPSGCSDPNYMGSLYKRTSQYVQSLLAEPSKSALKKPLKDMTPGERLWHECPEECSFYITYDVTTVRGFCDHFLNIRVHCGHQKKGFLGKYSVQVNQVTDMMCKGFQNDKLVLKRVGAK